MPRVIVPLADGAEEMELVIIADTLRRAEWQVVLAGLDVGPVTASRGVKLVPDAPLDALNGATFDMIVLPGGMPGTEKLRADPRVIDLVEDMAADGKWVAAICAAPLVLEAAGLLADRAFTSHPSVADRLPSGERREERVVVDGRLVTSQGPGTCMEFALKLVELVDGADKAAAIGDAMRVHA
jgi:4-methyl-5(b-hydroxyethyl)-thiazole monophosphate biosynthesis